MAAAAAPEETGYQDDPEASSINEHRLGSELLACATVSAVKGAGGSTRFFAEPSLSRVDDGLRGCCHAQHR